MNTEPIYGRLDMTYLLHEKFYGSLGINIPFIEREAQGESPLLITDAKDNKELLSFIVAGKSTQSGTPSPETPVEIVSAGQSGQIKTDVLGGNLLDLSQGKSGTGEGVTYTKNPDGSYRRTGTATGTTGNVWFLGGYALDPNTPENVLFTLKPGTYTFIDGVILSNKEAKRNTFTIDSDFKVTGVRNPSQELEKTYNDTIYPMLNVGSSALPFESYKQPQTLILTTPDGLPGIPVSGDDYTYIDSAGQKWICDEIDLARGKYVQRIGHNANVNDWVDMPGSQNIEPTTSRFALNIENIDNYRYSPCICNRLSYAKVDSYWKEGTYVTINEPNSKRIFARIEGITSLEDFTATVPDLEVIWLLETPIETDLTAEEIATYKALHTNEPTTTIMNDADAWMKVRYHGK